MFQKVYISILWQKALGIGASQYRELWVKKKGIVVSGLKTLDTNDMKKHNSCMNILNKGACICKIFLNVYLEKQLQACLQTKPNACHMTHGNFMPLIWTPSSPVVPDCSQWDPYSLAIRNFAYWCFDGDYSQCFLLWRQPCSNWVWQDQYTFLHSISLRRR